jgi:hypothetical protein
MSALLIEKPLSAKNENETAELRGSVTESSLIRLRFATMHLGTVLALGHITAVGAVVRKIQLGQQIRVVRSQNN